VLQAIPDVSAQGDNFEFVFQGGNFLVGGTSASSPSFAGIVALLNDARIAAGKPPLGFLNPLIYSKAFAVFNDITVGNNPGCGTEGFFARVGWDAGNYYLCCAYSNLKPSK
jgi:tripeptidyl-peptidase-1